MDERQVLNRITSYVPPYWVRQAFIDPEHTLVGREARINAAVLFADISGFTPIAEVLSQRGREGVEELSAILDRYFGAMSKPAVAMGGEIVKFAGDSLLVLFPVQPDGEDAHLGAALNCALEMQGAMSRLAQVYTSAGVFPLRLKIGISEGTIYTITVGDEVSGMQPVFVGRPIARCMQADEEAEPGEIVADAGLVNRMPGRLDIGEARGTFRLIVGARELPDLRPVKMESVENLSIPRVQALVARLAPYLPPQVVERIRQEQQGIVNEHRLVTVMFVKFSGLDYDLDLSVGQALQVYFTTMRECIQRYGGRLNEVDMVGDGSTLVVFFGAPTAHEDDELRAVSCAWELQQAVADVRVAAGPGASQLRQCIGVSTGNLFVGEVGTTIRRTYTAVGDEVNLASRLMDVARWGEVMVTSWVQKRVVGRFELEAMGEVKLKGKVEPVPLFALTGRSQDRGQGKLLMGLMDYGTLVGRGAELATLRAVRDRAWQGEPQLLLISGEAGVGKSHLLGVLTKEWLQQGGGTFAVDCHHHGGNVPNGLWLALLRDAFGLQEEDSPQRRREKIELQLTFLAPSMIRRAQLFDDVLGSATMESGQLREGTPDAQSQDLCQAVVSVLQLVAQRKPLLVILENMHEIDTNSLSLMSRVLADLGTEALFFCGAYRPTEGFDILDHPVETTRLVLDVLSEADSFALAEQLLTEAGLPHNLAPQVVEQAYGNPFYLKEMVSALQGFQDPGTALAQRMVIPESISDTIQSQLDPLGEDYKLTLRTAAVIGQLFSVGVLEAALPVPASRSQLANRLSRLERMHVVRLDHFGDDIVYRFRHSITQQAIYAALLSGDRERIHRKVAQALERVYWDKLDTRYELLAFHFHRGGMLTKAVNYLMLAGRRAVDAQAVREALAHYDMAEEILALCYTCAPRCSQGVQLCLLMDRGNVHYQLADITAAIADYDSARLVAGDLADLEAQGRALLHLGEISVGQTRYAEAQVLFDQSLQRFVALEDKSWMAKAFLGYSHIHAYQGRLKHAHRFLEQAMTLEDSLEDLAGSARCRSWQGALDGSVGSKRSAIDVLRRASELGYRAGEPIVAARALMHLAEVYLGRGRWGQAIELSQEAIATCRALSSRLDLADTQRVHAQVLLQVGAYEEALDHLDEAMATFAGAEWRVGLAAGYWIAGEALLAMQRDRQAVEHLHQALRLGRDTHTVNVIVRAQIGLGNLAALRGEWHEAQRLCTEARARARQAGLEPLVTAARLGLAKAHLGRREWKHAQREASQAMDESYRQRRPYDTVMATALLSQALMGVGQSERARKYSREAQRVATRLAETLPQWYADLFLDTPCVRLAREQPRSPMLAHVLQVP